MGLSGRRAARAAKEISGRDRLLPESSSDQAHSGRTTAGLADAYAKSGQTGQGRPGVRRRRCRPIPPTPALTTSMWARSSPTPARWTRPSRPSTRPSKLIPTVPTAYYWKGVDMIGKATTERANKMVAPAGNGRGVQQVSGAGSDRQVCGRRQADAGHHRRHRWKPATASRTGSRKPSS